MKQRILTGIILLCLLVPVLVFSGTWLFPIVAAGFCTAAVYEMLRCLGTHRILPIAIPAYLLSVGFPLGTVYAGGMGDGFGMQPVERQGAVLFLLLLGASMTLYLFILFAAAVFSRRALFGFSDAAASYTMTYYIVLAFTTIPLIRMGQNGEYYYLLCFLGPWITDTFAYFTGYFFGRHKLIPEISPKKTVEGAIGGVLFCMLFFLLYGFAAGKITGLRPNYLVLGLVGALVSCVSQIGDLIASLIKREHGVKDYSQLFPGHGGVMDRFDSVVAAAPLLLIICTVDSLYGLHLLL